MNQSGPPEAKRIPEWQLNFGGYKMRPALLQFEEAYFERIWGGERLGGLLGKPAPAGAPVGEAWLVADHASHGSRVLGGPWAGQSIHSLLEAHGGYLLGTLAKPTVHGRFPLLLKLLDAADVLSVQVHPDDAAAAALGEPDVGKTEMWHVLESDPGSELICGLDPAVSKDAFLQAVVDNTVHTMMRSFPAPPGTSVFVAAGTVHAIGGGILLAEIQQNSDLTYRIYDWDRTDRDGARRELHLDKAAQVTHFGSSHGGPVTPLSYRAEDGTVTILGACRHFATALLESPSGMARETHGRSFHLILSRESRAIVYAGRESVTLARGAAVLVPGAIDAFHVESEGAVLDYFVPDLMADVVEPLRNAGHSDEALVALGGDVNTSNLVGGISP